VLEKRDMQEFIILSGLPGSGKSTYAKWLKSARGIFVVSSDTTRLALNAGIYPRDDPNGDYTMLEPIVWALVERAVMMLLQAGHSVAIDATNLTKARRLSWQNVARSVVPDIRITIVWCTGNWDSPSRWLEERGCTAEEYWQIRQKLEMSVEVPTADEAWAVQFI
jgi:predicted kinase